MRSFLFPVLLISLFSTVVFAQSGRAPTAETVQTPAVDERSVEQLYAEASGYAKRKFAEYEEKKVPFSETLREDAVREQKQLAAKHAALAGQRENLAGEDFYFLGMLHWMTENADGAGESLRKFLAVENANAQKLQTARVVVAVVSARAKNFERAETLLADYLKNESVKPSEQAFVEREIIAAYRADKNFVKAAERAEQLYRAAKIALKDAPSRASGLNRILDASFTAFDAYSEGGLRAEADRTLEDLRRTAVAIGSIEIYYAAIDRHIEYLIETKRKAQGLEMYEAALKQTTKDFAKKPQQDDVIRRLKKREKQYELLGEIAPEIVDVDRWFPGAPQTFSNLRGKVVLLDFWAMWCGPCIAAFPALTDWQQTYEKDGFVIVGLTRYYDRVQTEKVDNTPEIARLKSFRIEHKLPYDFAVATTSTSIDAYGATGLPTTVLIDRKGIVRSIETGTNRSREEALRRQIERLLAEK